MTFDPVAFASRGARSFQYDELKPPPASRTRAGSLPSATWKTSSCSAFVTLRVWTSTDEVGADVVVGVLDDGLLATVCAEHDPIDAARRTAEVSAIALRCRRIKCSAMT